MISTSPGTGAGSSSEGLKGFHRAHDHVPFVLDGRGADQKAKPLANLIENAHALINARSPVLQGGPQETALLATVRLKDLPAMAAQGFLLRKAGDLLGPFVESRDPPALVDDEETPLQIFKDRLGLHPQPEVGPDGPGPGQGIIMKGEDDADDFLVLAIKGSYRAFPEQDGV